MTSENNSEPDASPKAPRHPHSGNWYATRRGEKLHFRIIFPDCQPKALCFFIHGSLVLIVWYLALALVGVLRLNVDLTGSPPLTLHYTAGYKGNCNHDLKMERFRAVTSLGYVLVAPDLLGYVKTSSSPSCDCNCNCHGLIPSDFTLVMAILKV